MSELTKKEIIDLNRRNKIVSEIIKNKPDEEVLLDNEFFRKYTWCAYEQLGIEALEKEGIILTDDKILELAMQTELGQKNREGFTDEQVLADKELMEKFTRYAHACYGRDLWNKLPKKKQKYKYEKEYKEFDLRNDIDKHQLHELWLKYKDATFSSYQIVIAKEKDNDFSTAYSNQENRKLRYLLIQYAKDESRVHKNFTNRAVHQVIDLYYILAQHLCRDESLYYKNGASFLSYTQIENFGYNRDQIKLYADVLIHLGYLNKITVKHEGCLYYPLFVRGESIFLNELTNEEVLRYFFQR